MFPPVLKQSCGFRRDLPLLRIRKRAPLIHILSNLIDDCVGVVLLSGCCNRRRFFFFKNKLALSLVFPAPTFSGLRNGCNERRLSARIQNIVRRLAFSIQFPMLRWVLVRRIQNRPFEEVRCHERVILAETLPMRSRKQGMHRE